MPLTS
ncbi:Protein of unknown function [Lactobacillus delbrueckii subsp. bulgaricus]